MALLGPNGAGKTTTLKMLSGLLNPTSGTIRFHGQSGREFRKLIGYLPQYPAFFNWMSGREFLEFTAKLAGMGSKEAAGRANELLERIGLKDAAKRRIGGYSGGMKQRLGLAQAIIHRPKLLILDEPVSALDPQGRREVMELLKAIKRETTVLFSTHILHDAEEISDDIMIMRGGRIRIQGDLRQLSRDHQKPQIRIRADHADPAWVHGLQQKPFVKSMHMELGRIILQVTDLSLARQALLKEIADLQVEIDSFETGHTTLEDLFMKAVQA
jgi:ABC-2 type transport system ATP-binding protein